MTSNWWLTGTGTPVASGTSGDVAAPVPHCGTGAAGSPASSLVPAGHDAAVHVPDGSGHPAGLIREEKRDRRGDVAGGTHAAQRVKGVKAGQRLVDLVLRDESFVQRGLHHGRGYRVYANLVLGQFDGQIPGQRMEPVLGHRVGRGRSGGDPPGGPPAAVVYDGPPVAAGAPGPP